MTRGTPQLHPADRIEITALVDNYIDMFVPSHPHANRPPFALDRPLLAEHGLSFYINVFSDGKEHKILMDTGLSCGCMLHNARQLRISLDQIETVVLSHGHFDHTGGLSTFLQTSAHQVPVIVHPDAFLKRRLNSPGREPVNLPELDPVSLKKDHADIQQHSGPSLHAGGHLMATGEVERTEPFEKGFPGMEAWDGNGWAPDPIRDDQAIIANIQERGLVIISGCAHAGIINTIRHAQRVTGVDHIIAVLGGFHLTGPLFAPAVNPTIKAMKQIKPDFIVPMHCTGWDATNQFFTALPQSCILNTVGTTYRF